MTPLSDQVVRTDGEDPAAPIIIQRPFVCDACHKMSIGTVSTSSLINNDVHQEFRLRETQATWTPLGAEGKQYPDVPPLIASAASEVRMCLSIRAPKAAVALARATVEAAAKEQGVTSGNLAAKIDGLHAKGLIRESTKDAAHEVRLGGNEVAHGDLVDEPVSLDEAIDIVDLLDALLDELYQQKAVVERVRRKRAARQGRPAS